MAQQPLSGPSLLIIEGSWSHSVRRTTLSSTPLAEWSARSGDLYLTTHNTHNRHTSMSPAGFEPTNPASERPQTHLSDRAATRIGILIHTLMYLYIITRGLNPVHLFFQSEWKITAHESKSLKQFINIFSNCLLLIATQQSQKHVTTHYIIQGVQKSTLQLNTHHTLQCSTHQ